MVNHGAWLVESDKQEGAMEEIAGVALLLGTDAGSYITGTTVLIDGGTLANTL